jgi:hypothetical protein
MNGNGFQAGDQRFGDNLVRAWATSCSWVRFLCAVIVCRKALLEWRDQRVLELWLFGKS